MPQRIRIVQLIYSFDIEGAGGGIGRFAIALGRALDRKRFQVAICGLWDFGAPTEHQRIQQLQAEGLEAFTAAPWDDRQPARSLWRSYLGLRLALQHRPAKIVHSHSEFSDIVALMLKFSPGVPVIARTLHNGFQVEWRKRPWRRLLLTNFLHPLCYNAEIGVAPHVVGNLNRRWLARLLRRQALMIYNAIDLARFANARRDSQQIRATLGIPKEAFVAGSVGRLREEKGYDVLLQAAARLVRKEPDTYFVIVGEGDLGQALRAQSQELQVSERVIFTGPRSDVETLLGGMDLFVCSSFWEGLPTAVLEAMAAGTPVLATDIPGNRELIRSGENGWLVPARDPDALAEAIRMLRQHPERCQAFARRAFQDVQAFSIEAVADQHEQHYLDLLARTRMPGLARQ